MWTAIAKDTDTKLSNEVARLVRIFRLLILVGIFLVIVGFYLISDPWNPFSYHFYGILAICLGLIFILYGSVYSYMRAHLKVTSRTNFYQKIDKNMGNR